MVSSRDGQQWRRADPGPDGQRPKLIPRGPTLWDAMMIHTSTHPLLVDDTLHLYYQGDSCSHHGAVCVEPKTPTSIGLATLRKDGWAYLAHEAASAPGYVTTKALSGVGSGSSLRVNYKAGGGGSLRVALLDAASGNAIKGRTQADCAALTGDSTNQTVTWHGASDEAPGQVHIQFWLAGAVELYSFSFSV